MRLILALHHSDSRSCFTSSQHHALSGKLPTYSTVVIVNGLQTSSTGVQIVVLSATVAQFREAAPFSCLGVTDCCVIRAPTDWPETTRSAFLSPTRGDSQELLLMAVKKMLSE